MMMHNDESRNGLSKCRGSLDNSHVCHTHLDLLVVGLSFKTPVNGKSKGLTIKEGGKKFGQSFNSDAVWVG